MIRRRAEKREIDKELRSHLEMRIQDNIDEGMTPLEARNEAYQRFGNLIQIQQTCAAIKDLKSEAIMGAFLHDLRYGFRILYKKIGFTIVAVVTLALGIGINSSIFSIVNAVLLRPLPYKEPNRIVEFWETNPIKGWNGDTISCAPANFLDWKEQNHSFEEMAAYLGGSQRGNNGLSDFYLTGGDRPERLQGMQVTGEFFSVLGVPAELGRTLRPEETWKGNDLVVVLSHGLWERHFGSDPSVIGKTLQLNGSSYQIVGVMPSSFYFAGKDAELWAPMGWERDKVAQQRRPHYVRVIARLKPGVTVAQARAEMTGIASRLEQQYPVTNKMMGVGLEVLQNWEVADTRLSLFVFLGAVAFVLLIACANVANLLLARSATRTKEFALRAALGAGRERIARQLLTESFLLSALGGVAGLILASICNRLVIAFSPGGIPRLDEARLDFRVIAFTIGVSCLTAIVFGLVPAITASKTDLNDALKDAGQKGSTGKGSRLRNALVVAEIALSLVLVIGAGLMIKSFMRLQQVNPGFDTSNVLTMVTSLPSEKYAKDAQIISFYDQVLARIKTLPGVQSAAAVMGLPPLGSAYTSDFTIEGRPPEEYGKEVRHNPITPDYFQTMKIPMIAGRNFTDADTATSLPVVIVTQALAHRYFPNQDPIGQHMKFTKPEVDSTWYTIVGIVSDVKQEGVATESRPQVYEAFAQNDNSGMYLAIRTTGDPHNLVSAVLGEIRAVDKDLPPYDIKTMEEVMSLSVGKERFSMLLLAIFAGTALVLASVGIYGVMSYTMSQRTVEIGIRMALGAQRKNVLAMILGQGMLLVAIGLAIGGVTAFVATSAMKTLLFNVSTTDPIVFLLISLLLTLVAMLACFMPARRATKIDPIQALRFE